MHTVCGRKLQHSAAPVKVRRRRRAPTRSQAIRSVNTQLIAPYRSIGETIVKRQAVEGWESGFIGRLAEDLGAEF